MQVLVRLVSASFFLLIPISTHAAVGAASQGSGVVVIPANSSGVQMEAVSATSFQTASPATVNRECFLPGKEDRGIRANYYDFSAGIWTYGCLALNSSIFVNPANPIDANGMLNLKIWKFTKVPGSYAFDRFPTINVGGTLIPDLRFTEATSSSEIESVLRSCLASGCEIPGGEFFYENEVSQALTSLQLSAILVNLHQNLFKRSLLEGLGVAPALVDAIEEGKNASGSVCRTSFNTDFDYSTNFGNCSVNMNVAAYSGGGGPVLIHEDFGVDSLLRGPLRDGTTNVSALMAPLFWSLVRVNVNIGGGNFTSAGSASLNGGGSSSTLFPAMPGSDIIVGEHFTNLLNIVKGGANFPSEAGFLGTFASTGSIAAIHSDVADQFGAFAIRAPSSRDDLVYGSATPLGANTFRQANYGARLETGVNCNDPESPASALPFLEACDQGFPIEYMAQPLWETGVGSWQNNRDEIFPMLRNHSQLDSPAPTNMDLAATNISQILVNFALKEGVTRAWRIYLKSLLSLNPSSHTSRDWSLAMLQAANDLYSSDAHAIRHLEDLLLFAGHPIRAAETASQTLESRYPRKILSSQTFQGYNDLGSSNFASVPSTQFAEASQDVCNWFVDGYQSPNPATDWIVLWLAPGILPAGQRLDFGYNDGTGLQDNFTRVDNGVIRGEHQNWIGNQAIVVPGQSVMTAHYRCQLAGHQYKDESGALTAYSVDTHTSRALAWKVSDYRENGCAVKIDVLDETASTVKVVVDGYGPEAVLGLPVPNYDVKIIYESGQELNVSGPHTRWLPKNQKIDIEVTRVGESEACGNISDEWVYLMPRKQYVNEVSSLPVGMNFGIGLLEPDGPTGDGDGDPNPGLGGSNCHDQTKLEEFTRPCGAEAEK